MGAWSKCFCEHLIRKVASIFAEKYKIDKSCLCIVKNICILTFASIQRSKLVNLILKNTCTLLNLVTTITNIGLCSYEIRHICITV